MTQPSTRPITGRLVLPDAYGIRDGVDYEAGATPGVNRPSIRDSEWKMELLQGWLVIKPPNEQWFAFYQPPSGSSNYTFTFDGAMQPAIAYAHAGAGWLYWFDATLNRYDLLSFPGVTSPFLGYTFSPDTSFLSAQIVLAYVRAGRVYARFQESRFTVEVDYGALPLGFSRITGVGLGSNWRLHIRIAR